jgi:hypothetical protein
VSGAGASWHGQARRTVYDVGVLGKPVSIVALGLVGRVLLPEGGVVLDPGADAAVLERALDALLRGGRHGGGCWRMLNLVGGCKRAA